MVRVEDNSSNYSKIICGKMVRVLLEMALLKMRILGYIPPPMPRFPLENKSLVRPN